MNKTFKRDIASLDHIFEALFVYIKKHKIDKSTAFVMNLVAEEIFTNLVKYDPEADEEIPFSVHIDGPKIEMQFINSGGHEFNLAESKAVDTSLPLKERKVGGLGLHLVRHMVDDISYDYTDGTSIIRIVKFLEDRSV